MSNILMFPSQTKRYPITFRPICYSEAIPCDIYFETEEQVDEYLESLGDKQVMMGDMKLAEQLCEIYNCNDMMGRWVSLEAEPKTMPRTRRRVGVKTACIGFLRFLDDYLQKNYKNT